MEIILALTALVLVPFLVAALLPRGRLTLIGIPVAMLAAYLLSRFGVPSRGPADAAGHGMALGYYAMMVAAGLLGAGMGWLAQMARHIWPELEGWRYALLMAALFVVVLAFAAGTIL